MCLSDGHLVRIPHGVVQRRWPSRRGTPVYHSEPVVGSWIELLTCNFRKRSEQWVEVQNWFGLLITPLPSLSIPRHFKLIYFGIKITSTQDGEVIPKKRISDRKKCLMKNLLNQDDSHLINFHIPDQPNWVKIKNSFMWSVFVSRPRSFQRFHAVIMKLYKPHHHWIINLTEPQFSQGLTNGP